MCFWKGNLASAASSARRNPTDRHPPVLRAGVSSRRNDDDRARYNINTCHVWDEHGDHVKALDNGSIERGTPLFIRKRFAELGRDGEAWQSPVARSM